MGKSRKEPKQLGTWHPQSRTKRNECTHSFVLHFLCQISLLIHFRNFFLVHGVTHNGLDFLTSIKYVKENNTERCLQAYRSQIFLQCDSLPTELLRVLSWQSQSSQRPSVCMQHCSTGWRPREHKTESAEARTYIAFNFFTANATQLAGLGFTLYACPVMTYFLSLRSVHQSKPFCKLLAQVFCFNNTQRS